MAPLPMQPIQPYTQASHSEQAEAILAKVRGRQQELGYADYKSWMETNGVAPLEE